ncbi:hypothetical protein D3C81_2220530 [compost metagenome]
MAISLVPGVTGMVVTDPEATETPLTRRFWTITDAADAFTVTDVALVPTYTL